MSSLVTLIIVYNNTYTTILMVGVRIHDIRGWVIQVSGTSEVRIKHYWWLVSCNSFLNMIVKVKTKEKSNKQLESDE